jgi:peptidoglycan/xylan/chitin deacetylase (PgdA/CDA1 family)
MLDAITHGSGMIALEEGGNLPPLLYYHRVAPYADPDTGPVPEVFDRQMNILKALGFRGVTLREALMASADQSAGMIGITFDDGYRDNYEWAAPILEKYGFRGTIFCVTGVMGQKTAWAEDPRWVGHLLMTPEEARELSGRGFEIAAHSRTHPDLTTLSEEELQDEVAGSRRELEDLLGEPVETFCYPYGFYNPQTMEAVRKAGYLAARSTRRMRPGKQEDRFDLPARSISGEMSLPRFAATVMGYALVEHLRRPVPPRKVEGAAR